MTIQQCKYTIEIANCGTFNEAAKRLFVAQSSLSASIKELEMELDITIFERSKKGIEITVEGAEFLEYAKQVLAQVDLISMRYHGNNRKLNRFSVSSQHYDFAAEAFARLVKSNTDTEFDYRFKETKTYEVIENVKSLESEIGILFTNYFNQKVMCQNFEQNNLEFHPLFESKPHIFIKKDHPLSTYQSVLVEELRNYPYIIFEQDKNSSIQYAEEVYYFTENDKQIKVYDRATLLNLLIETEGYTIGSGVIASKVQLEELVSIPIDIDQVYTVGWISRKGFHLSEEATTYIQILSDIIMP